MSRHKDVLTVGEVAEFLRIPRSSVYKLAQDGRIPCQKAGRQWRFSARAIESWLAAGPVRAGVKASPHSLSIAGSPHEEAEG